jgi:uncharacterized surface protein with fasciclin (FAS1) repeats
MSAPNPDLTIAAQLGLSGIGLDADADDFDLLNAALGLAGLTPALAAADAELTLFAPTDLAFIRLAQSFGFTGSDEAGALDAIVDALTSLSPNGNPIPLLTTVLTYHVVAEPLTAAQIAAAASIDTLADLSITPAGRRLGDLDPSAPDPQVIASRADQVAANGLVQAIDRVLLPADVPQAAAQPQPPPTLYGLVADGGNFDILQAALEAAGLDAALDDAAARLTLLAPTDAAFLKLARSFGFTGTDETEAFTAIAEGLAARSEDGNPIPLLTDILTYHVVDGAATRQALAGAGEATTLSGDTLGFQGRFVIDGEPDSNAALVIPQTNIRAENGVLNAVDTVLLPFDFQPTIADFVVSGTGFDANLSDFDVLQAALQAAGLSGALDDPNGDLTLFAPTDLAFVRLAEALGGAHATEEQAFTTIVDALTGLGGGDPVPLLTEILLYHVAEGGRSEAELIADGTVETLQGGSLGTFDTAFGTFLGDADASARNPRIIGFRADEEVANGLVQAIDRVLLPIDLAVI